MIARSNVDNLTHPGRKAARHDVVRIARGPWAGRVGVVEGSTRKAVSVRVDPRWSATQKARISDSVARLRREGYGRAQAVRIAFAEERERSPNKMKFLINPPEGGSPMASAAWKREHPRNARGRFVKTRGRSRRRNPRRRRRNMPRGESMSSAERAHLSRVAESRPRNRYGQFVSEGGRRRNPGHRRYHHERWSPSKHPRNRFGEFVRTTGRRHNPPVEDLPSWIGGGLLDAGELLAGKAVTKVLPGLVKLPTTGNTSYAVQLLVAVGLGWVADRFGGENVGKMVLAGGLSAPIEAFIEEKNIPYIGPALKAGTLSAWSDAANLIPAGQGHQLVPMSAWSGGASALYD